MSVIQVIVLFLFTICSLFGEQRQNHKPSWFMGTQTIKNKQFHVLNRDKKANILNEDTLEKENNISESVVKSSKKMKGKILPLIPQKRPLMKIQSKQKPKELLVYKEGFGKISLVVSPVSSCTIFIDGVKGQKNNIINFSLPKGFHVIKLVASGFEIWEELVNIFDKKLTTIHITLKNRIVIEGKYYRKQRPFFSNSSEMIELKANSVFGYLAPFDNSPQVHYASYYKGKWKRKGQIYSFNSQLKLSLGKNMLSPNARVHVFERNKLFESGEIIREEYVNGAWERETFQDCDQEVKNYFQKLWLQFFYSSNLVCIEWDDRRYLVDSSSRSMSRFIKAVVKGKEPRKSRFGDFYMKADKDLQRPQGLPHLPAKWQKKLIAALIAKREIKSHANKKENEYGLLTRKLLEKSIK